MINTVHCWLCKQLAALSGTENKQLTHRDQNANKNAIYNLVADQIKNSMAKKVLSALKKQKQNKPVILSCPGDFCRLWNCTNSTLVVWNQTVLPWEGGAWCFGVSAAEASLAVCCCVDSAPQGIQVLCVLEFPVPCIPHLSLKNRGAHS